MLRLLSIALILFSGTVTFAQGKALEQQINDWESNKTLEEVNNEINRLQSENGDKNFTLVLESISALKRRQQLERTEILIHLSERNEGKNNYYAVYSNYHIAAALNLFNIPSFALEYADKAIHYSKISHHERLLYLSYKIKAGIFFKLKSFEKARKSFMDASKTHGQGNLIEIASDYNNLALCDVELKQYHKAIQTYEAGKRKLDIKKHPYLSDIYYLIQGNIGSAYVKLGDLENGKKYLKEETNYYRSSKIESDNYVSSLMQLIAIELKQKNTTEAGLLGDELFHLISRNEDIVNRLQAIEFLTEKDKIQFLSIDKTELNVLHNRILIDQLARQEKLRGGLTNFLYEEKVKTIINNRQSADQEKKTERWKFIYALLACLIFASVMIYGYIVLKKRIARNQQEINEKNKAEEMIRNKQIALEKEMESQQQQLNVLLTNLKIKQQTETGFLEKIKELKKNKNVTTDQVMQQLQIGLSNLFDIDKKLIHENKVEVDFNANLIGRFSEKHPELTEMELEMCSYFVSQLTAKEIGLLLNISDVSVRVAKNKIKKKIGISKETNLNTYLQSLLN